VIHFQVFFSTFYGTIFELSSFISNDFQASFVFSKFVLMMDHILLGRLFLFKCSFAMIVWNFAVFKSKVCSIHFEQIDSNKKTHHNNFVCYFE